MEPSPVGGVTQMGLVGDYTGIALNPPHAPGGQWPSNFDNPNTLQTQPVTINTNSTDYPGPYSSPTSGDVNMGDWYGYDHDAAGVASADTYTGPALFAGDGGTSLFTYNIDLSGPTYAGSTIVTTTGRLFLAYRSGTSYTGDIQLTTITYNSPNVQVDFKSPWPSPPAESWQTNPSTGHSTTPATSANATLAYDGLVSTGFTSVTNTTSSTKRWNYRPTGEGPSSNTGITDPTGAIYAETSSSPSRWMIARSPSITFTSDDVTLKMYRWGATVGTCFFGVQID